MNIYDFEAKDIKENIINLSKYKEKVLLIVNTSTNCKFTNQYKDLQVLYEKYKDKGLEILDFTCDQFNHKSAGSNAEISSFGTNKFHLTFKQFAKIDVNGENEHPLYTYLKNEKGGLFTKDIKWNFTKFLVDRKGNVIKRFSPMISPERLEKDIENLL